MRNYNVTYYVKPEIGLNGKPIFWVYAHYPNTKPDTPYMIFDFVENAEMFCKVMNAENNHMSYIEPVKRGKWLRMERCNMDGDITYSANCSVCSAEVCLWQHESYCPCCGARMCGDKLCD